MSTLIIAIFFISIFHLIYESIVAPSVRLDLRYQLFSLRDELRNLKIEHADKLDKKHFTYLHESINVTIAFLSRFDASTIVEIQQQIAADPALKKRLEERSKILDDCGIDAAKQIRRKTLRVAKAAFAVNTGGWALYLVPIVVACVCVSSLKKTLRELTALPEDELEQRFPSNDSVIGSAA